MVAPAFDSQSCKSDPPSGTARFSGRTTLPLPGAPVMSSGAADQVAHDVQAMRWPNTFQCGGNGANH